MTDIKKRLIDTPHKPGVYLMKDRKGRIIYIGKARDLRKRLASHFQKSDHTTLKQALMVSKVARFETIITQTENEALILEAGLVHRHQPRYNVILKDDKRYPFFRIDRQHPFPRLQIVRKMAKDDAHYFGPYSSASAVRETFKFINKTFKLRKCKARQFKSRTRPCLHFQIGACRGPCVFPVSPAEYRLIVDEVVMFLKGRTPELIQKLRNQMSVSSNSQDYERARELRDRIYALERVLEKQSVVSKHEHDRDVIASAINDESAVITILSVRNGFLMDTRHFDMRDSINSDATLIEEFVKQYYPGVGGLPKEILTSVKLESPQVLADWLSDLKGRRVRLTCPRKGEKRRLVNMAIDNARSRLTLIKQDHDMIQERLVDIQQRLGLVVKPMRIECFDNSTLFGSDAVSAMVVFLNGQPLKSDYRTYRLQTDGPGDDYSAMAEVIQRRYEGQGKDLETPDLLLIDGGRGQLNVVSAVLRNLGLEKRIPVAAIAKPNTDRGEKDDKIYVPGRLNPVRFGIHPAGLLYLQRIRDEAHRFVISFHRRSRRNRATRSVLDEIPGVGPKRRQALLQHFLTVENLVAASVEQMCQVPGIYPKIANDIRNQLKTVKKTG